MSRVDSRVPGVHKSRIAAVLLAVALLASAAEAKHKKKHHPTPKPAAGSFDYYVASLSWSPEHCAEPAGKSDNTQCHSQRHFAFVLHGLWPQFEKGYPQACSTVSLSPTVRDSMLDIMPSTKLVQHEWTTHGTCSGLSAEDYFARARAAFTSVKIPAAYQGPNSAFTTDTAAIEQAFGDVNPALQPDRIAVQCQGRFLQEVRICMTKELEPRKCGADVKDHCGGDITVRPVK